MILFVCFLRKSQGLAYLSYLTENQSVLKKRKRVARSPGIILFLDSFHLYTTSLPDPPTPTPRSVPWKADHVSYVDGILAPGF